MRTAQQRLIGMAALALAALAPLSARADSTWAVVNCQSTPSNCAESGDPAPNVSLTAYSAVINRNNTTGAYVSTGAFTTTNTSIGYYDGGIGVTAPGGDSQSPNHAIDNYGYQDLVLLQFADLVKLTSVKIGWSQYDSDITVLAYTGDTTGLSASSTIAGKTASTLLSTGGWALVGSYADLVAGNNTAINSQGLSSSWWIITAYNTQLGGSTTKTAGTATGLTMGNGTAYAGYDFVKLYSVTGTSTTRTNVPEPATLALSAVALLGVVGVRRRRQKAQDEQA